MLSGSARPTRTISTGLSRGFPSPTVTYGLEIWRDQFKSFATPAITVPFPSAYAQTQIPFTYQSAATFAATRIPTTIGGVAATAGISTALYVNGGQSYGLTGANNRPADTGGKSVWPVWATAVIAACGGVALLVVLLGVWCLCRRRRRRRAAGLVANKGYGAEKNAAVLTSAPKSKKKKAKKGQHEAVPLTMEKEHTGHPSDTNAFYASAATQQVPSSRVAKALKPTRRDPYPPSALNAPMPAPLAAPRRREHSGGRNSGVPVTDGFGRVVDPDYMPHRFSSDTNGEGRGGYATPQSDLDAPSYADGGSSFGSPARLWNPDEAGTPRSSVSNSQRQYPKGTRLYNEEMAGSLGALDLSQPRTRENSAETPMLHHGRGHSRNNSLPRGYGDASFADPWRDTRDRTLRRPHSDIDLGTAARYDIPDRIQPPQPVHHYREESSELAYAADPNSSYQELPLNSPTFPDADDGRMPSQTYGRALSPAGYEEPRRSSEGRRSKERKR